MSMRRWGFKFGRLSVIKAGILSYFRNRRELLMRITFWRGTLLLLCVTVICELPAAAKKKKHAPLRQTILEAETVYLDNRSGFPNIGDRAYDELTKWGHFRVVQNPKDADLIFLLSATEYRGGYVSTGSTQQQGRIDDSGNIEMSGETTTTSQPVVYRRTHLTVIDPKNGESLWSDSKPWGNLYTGFHSATRGLIKNLRERIEEQKSPRSE